MITLFKCQNRRGQLWAKENERRRKMGPTMGQKKVSQLWAEKENKEDKNKADQSS